MDGAGRERGRRNARDGMRFATLCLEQNRAEAAHALSRVEQTTLAIVPQDAEILASQRVDR